jgi:hypothetical protein
MVYNQVVMKPRLFFPVLLAAVALTALMLLFMSSAALVAGLPSESSDSARGESTPPDHASSPLTVTPPVSLPWQAIVPGIDYIELRLKNPANNVYVARMHRDALTVTLDTSIASGYLADNAKETVSQQAERYNQAINYWGQAPLTPTWGSRNEVVVAINGSYYDVPTGIPWSGMVQSGWYAKRFDDLGGTSGFAWKLDRSAFIGECVYHRPAKQLITSSGIFSQTFQGINIPRTNRTLVVYTPQYAADTGTDNSGTEVLVTLSRPLLIIPSGRIVTGTVTAVYTGTGSTPIPFDSVVLSAGKVVDDDLAQLQVGEVISISQEIRSYRFDCTTLMDLDWGKTYASLSGGFYFLRNGNIRHFYDDQGATTRAPRTAIVFNDDYIYFVVVDGRSWESQGMTIDELALFARDTLSATYGTSQDGGGSSTMVVNGQVMNNTLCNNVFCEHYNFLPIVGRPPSTITTTQSQALQPSSPLIHSNEVNAVTAERYVANGVMMLVVEPLQTSTTFTPTQVVKTASLADLRLGPGTNYAGPWDIAKNTLGVIVDHSLNGVLAKGEYWWKVDFNGKVGWVAESALSPVLDTWR